MSKLSRDAYHNAFIQYLRKGIPITHSLAAMHKADATSRYVWRTRGDSNVRTSHAENNGKIFSWDAPPPTGHPGAEYGCRCIAEPYREGITEYASQELISYIGDASESWSNADFLHHFLLGNGKGLTLAETGHLRGVIEFYLYHLGKYDEVNAQIINEARKHDSGAFGYYFDNSYDFTPYLYVFGESTVRGVFSGSVQHLSGRMRLIGKIKYFYTDEFTDPFDLRERVTEELRIQPIC